MLTWSSHDHIVGTITAVGLRGVYSVSQVGPAWMLSGVGHDDLPLLSLPVSGRVFARLDDAKYHAQRLDAVKTVEPQISGA